MDAQHFANTLATMRPATIAALIDFSEGNIFALFADPWVMGALEQRNLVQSNFIENFRLKEVAVTPTKPDFELTDYGRAFVAWYRQPKDLPVQMSLFGDSE